jgi:DMSO/TMAO reductase YedYZ heme-binding membrane subunit
MVGKKTWRILHFLSFLTFLSVLVHAFLAGTDILSPAMQFTYLGTGSLLVFMVLYRIFAAISNNKEKKIRLQSIPPKLPVNK